MLFFFVTKFNGRPCVCEDYHTLAVTRVFVAQEILNSTSMVCTWLACMQNYAVFVLGRRRGLRFAVVWCGLDLNYRYGCSEAREAADCIASNNPSKNVLFHENSKQSDLLWYHEIPWVCLWAPSAGLACLTCSCQGQTPAIFDQMYLEDQKVPSWH